jgi:hypothetical protein
VQEKYVRHVESISEGGTKSQAYCATSRTSFCGSKYNTQKSHPSIAKLFHECCWDMHGTQFNQQQEYVMGGILQVYKKQISARKAPPLLAD